MIFVRMNFEVLPHVLTTGNTVLSGLPRGCKFYSIESDHACETEKAYFTEHGEDWTKSDKSKAREVFITFKAAEA